MEQRVGRYEDRERLERDVEQLSDEGWVLEASFIRRPSAVSDDPTEEFQAAS